MIAILYDNKYVVFLSNLFRVTGWGSSIKDVRKECGQGGGCSALCGRLHGTSTKRFSSRWLRYLWWLIWLRYSSVLFFSQHNVFLTRIKRSINIYTVYYTTHRPILAGHVEYSESRCRHPQGGGAEVGPMRTKADKREGVNFGRYFAEVLYGWPLATGSSVMHWKSIYKKDNTYFRLHHYQSCHGNYWADVKQQWYLCHSQQMTYSR